MIGTSSDLTGIWKSSAIFAYLFENVQKNVQKRLSDLRTHFEESSEIFIKKIVMYCENIFQYLKRFYFSTWPYIILYIMPLYHYY